MTAAPALPATTLVDHCYYQMFYGCTNLNEITVGFFGWRDDLRATVDWVKNVASEGTFNCPRGLEGKSGASAIPKDWTYWDGRCLVVIPKVEHMTVSVSVSGTPIEPETDNFAHRFWVDWHETVTVTFGVDDAEKYVLVGKNQVVIKKIGQYVVFGATEGCPLPQVKRFLGQWTAGGDVMATLYDTGVLDITGTGAMYDFADAASVPWAAVADKVMAVTVAEGVTKVGKNALVGMDNLVTIDGDAVETTYRIVSTVNGESIGQFNMMGEALGTGPLVYPSSEPPIPDDKVLVTKESIAAPSAGTVTVEGNKVRLGVTVLKTSDLTAEKKDWGKVKLTKDNIDVDDDGNIIVNVPVDSASGFMVIQTKDAKIGTAE